ncbi:MAG: 4Fe-4S ferredoxin, partial [bacterium]|nr:4Fe-4S ferredoxin [bacterium]
VPDIGITASDDIAAVETASLDMIKTEDLIPNGMPGNRELLDEGDHLFERIHAKDPYHMLRELEKIYDCSSNYTLKEVK